MNPQKPRTNTKIVARIAGAHCGSRLCSVSIQALGPEGDPVRSLLPSQFILWADRNLVTDYDVIGHVNVECLFVGFALCPGQGISGELLSSAEEAVLGCLNLKARKDQWALAKFVSTREQPNAAAVSGVEQT